MLSVSLSLAPSQPALSLSHFYHPLQNYTYRDVSHQILAWHQGQGAGEGEPGH